MVLLTRWQLRELSAQEVHESAELLLDDAPSEVDWRGPERGDSRWGPRTVLELLADLGDALYFEVDIPALRALLEVDVDAATRALRWKAYCDDVDWEDRARRAPGLPYYRLWHRR